MTDLQKAAQRVIKAMGEGQATLVELGLELLNLQKENARLREALEAVLNADHRGVYDAAFRREAVAQAEALVAPGLGAGEREARALAAIHRRYSIEERDLAAENRAAIAEQEHGWREA